MLRFLARLLAVVLAALFICTTIAVVFLRPVGTRMLEPQTYKDVAREQRVAERLPELAADVIGRAMTAAGRKAERATTATEGDFAGWLEAFSTQDMQRLISAVLPADYVNGQLDGVFDQFFGYMNSEAPKPSVVLSFVDLKQRISGGVLEDEYVKVLQSKPPCADAAGAAALPVGCCPPVDRLPEVRARFREMVLPAVADMPDSVDLLGGLDYVRIPRLLGSVDVPLDQVRLRLQRVASVTRWLWLASAVLLVGVAVFGVRSWRGLLLWWGIPCLIAGVVAAVFALPTATMANWVFRELIAPQLPPEVPVLAVETVLGLVTAMAQVVLSAALKSAAWLALGGLVAVLVSPLFKTKAKPPALG